MHLSKGWLFIIVVLPVSWLIQFALFSGLLPERFLSFYMYVPAITALVFFLFSKHPLREQLALFTRRTGWWAWVFAVVYPIVWLGSAAMLAVVTGLGEFNLFFASQVFAPAFLFGIPVVLLPMLLSVFGEEYGWRGYLLPTFTKERGRLQATLITGAVWGLWHVPSYYIVYSQAELGNPLLLTALGVVTAGIGAFAYSYLFYLNGNILPAVLMHAIYDIVASSIVFGTPAIPGLAEASPGLVTVHWPYALGLIFATGVVAAVIFTRKFSGEPYRTATRRSAGFASKIKELANLKDQGLLTESEFEAKKQELLDEL